MWPKGQPVRFSPLSRHRDVRLQRYQDAARHVHERSTTRVLGRRHVALGSTTGASPPRALGGRAAVTPEKLNSSQPARARRLDEGAAAWLSRSFFRAAPPGWDMAPAIAALRRRLTEWAAASP